MISRRIVMSAVLAALFLHLVTSAQVYEPWWRRGRDNSSDRRYGYDRGLRDAIRRVESRSDDFQSHLDRALDRSRYDDSRREDRINDTAREFRDAARRLKDRFNERDPYRAESDARNLVRLGSRISRFMSRARVDSRTASDWSEISSNLRVIADAYRINFNDGHYRGGGIYNDDGYYGRDDDDYYRREQERRERERRRRNSGGWRLPSGFPFPVP